MKKAKAQRQEKLPLWRPLKDWKRHEWAPMKEVWQRAEKVIGSDLRDMQHDLRQDFLEKRLIMAVRLFAPDGTETWIIVEPECWQWLKINYAWSITGWEEIPGWKTEWEAEARKRKWERSALVVHRRELDKHYPATETVPSESPSTTKSKPGSADAWIEHVCPNGEWRLMTAKDIHKKIRQEAKTLGVKAPYYSAVATALSRRLSI
jgi:hypothetical protein